MFRLLERYIVQQLSQSGLPQQQIRALTSVSERTQRRINKQALVTDTDEANFRKFRSVGRPSTAEAFEQAVWAILCETRKPEDGAVKSIEIFTRLRREHGYQGGKTAVYELIRKLRPPTARVPVVRFEGLPGEFSQHDFGQRKVTFADGTTTVVHFFASRLKYSRLVDVQIVPNEQLETVVRSLLRAFERFGGMPLRCVFDNPKPMVTEHKKLPDGELKLVWNPRFAGFAIDCGFIPEACFPHRPNQKGSVENLVGFVKGNFFTGRTFQNIRDLTRQLEEWILHVNQERVCDATGEIPVVRLRREALRACPHKAQSYPFKLSAVVRPTARVVLNRIEYSVPAEHIGQEVTLHLEETTVCIYAGNRFLARHPRFPENGRSSVLRDHAEELFVFRRGKPYAMRQLLLDLDGSMEPYLTELVHRRPNGWQADVEQIYRLYERIGRSDLLAAVALAVEQHCFGGEYLVAIAEEVKCAGGIW